MSPLRTAGGMRRRPRSVDDRPPLLPDTARRCSRPTCARPGSPAIADRWVCQSCADEIDAKASAMRQHLAEHGRPLGENERSYLV
jgi:hypothetical protein